MRGTSGIDCRTGPRHRAGLPSWCRPRPGGSADREHPASTYPPRRADQRPTDRRRCTGASPDPDLNVASSALLGPPGRLRHRPPGPHRTGVGTGGPSTARLSPQCGAPGTRGRPRTCRVRGLRSSGYFTRICTVALPGRVVVVVVTRTRWLPTRTVLVTRRVGIRRSFLRRATAWTHFGALDAARRRHFGMVLRSSRQVGLVRPRPDKQPRSGPSSCLALHSTWR